MHNRDIVITGLQSWDIEIGSNCKNIAAEFAKQNRVLYVNPPLDRVSALRNRELARQYKTRGDKHFLKKVSENLWVLYPQKKIEPVSRMPFRALFSMINARNNRIFASEIQKAVQHLDFKNQIHFCDSDMFRSFNLKELLNPDVYIYYTRDNLLAVKYWQTNGPLVEPKHMAKADMVMANSTYLARIATEHNNKSYFVGQGCDLSEFRVNPELEKPGDMKNIHGPVIGYIGALKSLRLDADIFRHIAKIRPDWNLVLVGPEDDVFKNSDLHQFKNVHFLGSKPGDQLPMYLQFFDVAINPQVLNEVTIGNYPRKIDEYLAMGKPTIATKTEAMSIFSEHVLLCKNNNDWIVAIEEALKNNSPELEKKRTDFAAEHTWENNVKEIYSRIHQFETSIPKK